ncbi:MAG: tripartite tricarboxylate transporter TctB family protein [Brevibacterium sp.]
MRILRGDVITGAVITIVGLVYYIATFSIQETSDIVTPRTFPAIVGVALIVLGLFLAGQALYKGRKAAEAGDRDTASVADRGAGGAGVEAAGTVTGDRNGATTSAGDASDDSASAGTAAGVVLDAPEDPPSKKVVLQFALFFVYLAILIPVGFLLSTAAFLMALTSIYAPAKWIRNLIFSVLFAVIIYVAFVYGLAVYLPVGILG